ncbi:MAG TPA: hypothetical protein VNF73_04465 [Candidatus Saccharimonadales bacterium]|nr:hypothetical protein [Candidatus Saccharimonadales bacterium]HVC34656.1 hypothetical protein [Chloroflexota bacterium]
MAEEPNRNRSADVPGRGDGLTPPALRVAVGLGDAERERALLRELSDDDVLSVTARCLAADEVLGYAESGRIDAVVVAADLHRLSRSALDALARTRLPLVLLATPADDARWGWFPGPVLPLDATPELVRNALLAGVRGERIRPVAPASAPAPRIAAEPSARHEESTEVTTLGVVSGPGSPGRTLVAVNLAAALGAAAPTVLVDADLAGPSVAACLDADPTRNLFMLAHADPRTPREWDRALAEEVQPLDSRSPHGVVLCGVPKPEMRAGVSDAFVERLLAELERRYRFVVLDLGVDLLGANAGLHRLAVARSQRLLFVTDADLVGLWHARVGLGALSGQPGIDTDHLALVINRHDRRFHHRRSEIEWALGLPAAAVIPHDQSGIQRALQAQRPVVLDRRSRAGRALLDLAERLHGDRLRLPPEPAPARRLRWPRWKPRLPLALPVFARRVRGKQKGEPHACDTAATS